MSNVCQDKQGVKISPVYEACPILLLSAHTDLSTLARAQSRINAHKLSRFGIWLSKCGYVHYVYIFWAEFILIIQWAKWWFSIFFPAYLPRERIWRLQDSYMFNIFQKSERKSSLLSLPAAGKVNVLLTVSRRKGSICWRAGGITINTFVHTLEAFALVIGTACTARSQSLSRSTRSQMAHSNRKLELPTATTTCVTCGTFSCLENARLETIRSTKQIR